MYINTKNKGMVFEPENISNRPLFVFLDRHQATLDGSRLYEDLVDIYHSQEMDYKEEMKNERFIRTIPYSIAR